MKPMTVFWIAYCSAVLMFDLAVWHFTGEPWGLIWAVIAACALAFWIWRAVKENQHRRDMQGLVNDLAKQLMAQKRLIVAMSPKEDK